VRPCIEKFDRLAREWKHPIELKYPRIRPEADKRTCFLGELPTRKIPCTLLDCANNVPLKAGMSNPNTFTLPCRVCGNPVALDKSVSDHRGKAIHPECASESNAAQTKASQSQDAESHSKSDAPK